ncbi:stage II sporulation protein M [Candidatus Woesearchaeota archaeon]|nr:stage II sporulation protein M [Candidatus Woesearchaeota archaeon]
MVLEMLLNPRKAERSPWELFFIGVVYSTVAIFMSLLIFNDHIGLVMVFLTTIACTYLVQGTMRLEEKKDLCDGSECSKLREHTKALSVFMFMFLGFVVSFSFWYVVLPVDMTSQIFGLQEQTISAVNANISGNAVAGGVFAKIFLNNAKVLLFTLLFAFFYGAGAVFILSWNAAVVGVAIGAFARNALARIAVEVGSVGVGNYFSTYSLGLFRYMTHGTFEILAYFIAALAGGIISVAVAKHEFNTPKFKHVLLDSVDLIIISLAILIFAAAMEVFVTPQFF